MPLHLCQAKKKKKKKTNVNSVLVCLEENRHFRINPK